MYQTKIFTERADRVESHVNLWLYDHHDFDIVDIKISQSEGHEHESRVTVMIIYHVNTDPREIPTNKPGDKK